MKACNPGHVKIAIEYIIDLLVTPNDLKIENFKTLLYVYQMKASNLSNLKIAMEYLFDLLVTINDL